MDAAGGPPGWHGKLPSLGDFASRRLPHEFIDAWDGWLAGGLAALRQASPDGWLDGYLASPIWRFMLMPGALPAPSGDQGWAGVLMPSVDRAGRYFPFTAACPLPTLPHDHDSFTRLQRWLHQLDDMAADALQDDWTVPQLEAELERLRAPTLRLARERLSTSLSAGVPSAVLAIGSAAEVTSILTEDALGIWQTAASGQAFWWCEPGAEPGRLVVTRGLPAGVGIGLLFGSAGASATMASSTGSG